MNESFAPPRIAWVMLVLLVTACAFYALKAKGDAANAQSSVTSLKWSVDRLRKDVGHLQVERT